jgi:hypothetical protein
MKVQKQYKEFTKADKAKLLNLLNNAESMSVFLKILLENFDLDNCKPASITKAIISERMVNLVLPMINPNYKND